MATRLPRRSTRPSANRRGFFDGGGGGLPRTGNIVRGSFLPAAPERSGYRRRKILLTNPAFLDFGPTRALRAARAKASAVGQKHIAELKEQRAEKEGREAVEERDALVESLLLDTPQTFIDRKYPAATVKKLDIPGVSPEKKRELMQMLGEDPPLRSVAEKNLKRGRATTKKLVDYGVRKGYFERDPLEVAQAKARASRTGKGLSALVPKVSDYNTAINAWAKKYKVKAGLGLGVDEDGSLTMDMDAFTRGEQTFYEIMQGISDGSITDRRIPQEEATRDLSTIRGFYDGIRNRLEGEGTPVLPLPGAGVPGETVPAVGETVAQPGGALSTTTAFRDLPAAQRRTHPAYQAYKAARISGATHDQALSALQGTPPENVPPGTPEATPSIAPQSRGAPTATPSFPTTPPGLNTQDPATVSRMIDDVISGVGGLPGEMANTPIDIGGGQQVTVAEVGELIKENAALLPGFLVEFFIRNPIEGAKQIVKELTGAQAGPALPPNLG